MSDYIRATDWMPVQIGNHVVDKGDPRHVARVDSIEHSAWANLTWVETGWKSRVRLHKLERVAS